MFAHRLTSLEAQIAELNDRVNQLKAQQKKYSQLSRKAAALLEQAEELKATLEQEDPDAIAEFKNSLEKLFKISTTEAPQMPVQQKVEQGTELGSLVYKNHSSVPKEPELIEQPGKENSSNELFAWQPTSNPAIACYFNIGTGRVQATYIGCNRKGSLVSLGTKLLSWLPGISYEIRKAVRMSGYTYEMKVKGLDDDAIGWLTAIDPNKEINRQLWSNWEDCPKEALKGQACELCCPLPEIEPAAKDMTNSPQKEIEYKDLVANIDLEMMRLGWSVEDGKRCLKQKYGKASRQLLDDNELIEFWQYLKGQQPAKKSKRHTSATSKS